ncbi:probable polygalacturonase At3g15720 [Cannabis sativa]|uniref:probable polygalacturonase At3g15720 n=1 Tax=Cannabis sativa TaxID=3483 RepID=UPI0029CA0EE1|nr:probable polygalacturonase At3g15720 [Cannabis sativa]
MGVALLMDVVNPGGMPLVLVILNLRYTNIIGLGCYDRRPTTLKFRFCTKVRVLNILVINSPQVHVLVWNSQNVEINNLSITSPPLSPNTDGIHIEASTNIIVIHSLIRAGDDCISIGDQSSFIHVSNLLCGPGHGISIGSLGIGGSVANVHNIDVHGAHFYGTTNGVRIKTYQATAVHIDNVTFSNAIGTSSTEIAMNLNCSKSVPCTNINFKEIRLTPSKPLKVIQSSCNNAQGTTTGVVQPASCLHP